MTVEDRLGQLEKKLQYLSDRQEILDCIQNNARGNDRFETELLSGCYHEDGIHELRADAAIPGKEYGDHANNSHDAMCQQCMHNITTHTCEIDGDVAHADSYVIGLFLLNDSKTSQLLAGRYIDRLERRNGKWKIALRRITLEVVMTGDASMVSTQEFKNAGYLKGLRDKNDLSYQRPLKLEETPDGHRW